MGLVDTHGGSVNMVVQSLVIAKEQKCILRTRQTPAHVFHQPLPLNKTKQPYMQLTSIQLPGVQTNLSCLQSLCFNLQQPSKPLIHPPKMTVTDLAAKQSICISLTLSSGVDVQNIMKKCQW